MPQASHPPSVASLATALAAPDPAMHPPEARIAIARPPLRERILLLLALAILPLLGLAIAGAWWVMSQHIAAARSELRDRDRRVRETLPAEEVLLDAGRWRREAAAHPMASANLLLARCRLLAVAGRWDEIEASVALVAARDPGAILAETRLLLAEALLQRGHPIEAGQQLHRLADAGLEGDLAARLADLSARVWTATAPSRPPASALRPAEQPHEAASE